VRRVSRSDASSQTRQCRILFNRVPHDRLSGTTPPMKIEQFLINPHRARIVAQLFDEHEIMRDRLERLTVQVKRSEEMIREILDLLKVPYR
jgi:hypothetical protein